MLNMNKRTIMSILAACGGLGNAHTVPQLSDVNIGLIMGKSKGQKRNARPKASGVAASKRAATKRNNIRKRK